MSREKQLQASCAQLYTDYQKCLSASNRDPRKCAEFIPKLRSCEKSLSINYCIDETHALLACAKKPDSSVCAKEFIKMRECNRPQGPKLVLAEDAAGNLRYEVPRQKLSTFNSVSSDLGPADAPARSSGSLGETVDAMKRASDAKAFDFRAYTWESLRSNPGQ